MDGYVVEIVEVGKNAQFTKPTHTSQEYKLNVIRRTLEVGIDIFILPTDPAT